MVRAVASRVVPRARVSKSVARERAERSTRLVELAKKAGAPASAAKIPTGAESEVRNAKAFIRPVGCSRRVFLLHPYMSAEEMEGLAYWIRVLSKNDSLNSVLIATDDRDDAADNCLPSSVSSFYRRDLTGLDLDYDPAPGMTYHVAGGYDMLEVFESEKHKDTEHVSFMHQSLKGLVEATTGTASGSRIPVITMPHGAVTDGGLAMFLSSFTLATPLTCYRILNPSRGLSFDPIGLSFILPRLGWECRQRSAKYPGCGMLLALTGWEANAYDLVETGLVSHLVSRSSILPMLENILGSLPPLNQQKLLPKRKRYYGAPPPRDDNIQFHHVAVAHAIEQISDYSCMKDNYLDMFNAESFSIESSPALDVDNIPWDEAFFSSDLVDIAITFDEIFKNEKTVQGILERFREIGARQSQDPQEQEGIQVAKEIAKRMERQSPLALSVIHRLMTLGKRTNANLENCMEREARAQAKLLTMSDFEDWAKAKLKHTANKNKSQPPLPPFTEWKHGSLADVTADEVEEIVQGP